MLDSGGICLFRFQVFSRMSYFIGIFGAAFVLGMVFNAAPGPIFAESIRRSLTGGFDAAFRVQIGSLVGDATWAVLGLAGVGILLQADMLKVPVGLAGAGYLGWLAWDSWSEATKASRDAKRSDDRSTAPKNADSRSETGSVTAADSAGPSGQAWFCHFLIRRMSPSGPHLAARSGLWEFHSRPAQITRCFSAAS